jgi:hypothetical protein
LPDPRKDRGKAGHQAAERIEQLNERDRVADALQVEAAP